MENYNYFENVKSDVLDAIRENYETSEIIKLLATDRSDFAETLYDDLWTTDSVTGNASGSYTFSTYEAEEYLCHNMDILVEACEELGNDIGEAVKRGAEFCDVTIRCYYLPQAIAEALDDLANEYAEQMIKTLIDDEINTQIENGVLEHNKDGEIVFTDGDGTETIEISDTRLSIADSWGFYDDIWIEETELITEQTLNNKE